MTASSLLRFLEDFGRPSGAPILPAVPEFQPEYDVAATGAEEPHVLEEALTRAREEGAREARTELGERHRAELQKLRSDAEIAARKALEAEISALTGAMEDLFAQYDAWLDRLFETSLRPLVARMAHASALDEFKSRLLEAAAGKGIAVSLTGPQALVGQMAEMLRANGLEVELRADGSNELRAEIGSASLQTRLERIGELLSSGPRAAPEKRDA